jgi:hypothetical protein
VVGRCVEGVAVMRIKSRPSWRDLRDAYVGFNRKYFHNALPKDLPCYFRKLPTKSTFGHTLIDPQTDKPIRIVINKKLQYWHFSDLILMTLLHEMCHVENPGPVGHGPWFQRRMLRLAKAGAFRRLW